MSDNEQVISTLKALGDSTRFSIIQLISQSGNNLCVNAIAHKTSVTQPTVSQHLKILKNAGIVKSSRMGNKIHYSIDTAYLNSLVRQINQVMEDSIKSVSNENCR